jgi:hypothetical protein
MVVSDEVRPGAVATGLRLRDLDRGLGRNPSLPLPVLTSGQRKKRAQLESRARIVLIPAQE